MELKKLGRFLKELRNEKGITQEALAEKFNVSNRTVSRWETGANMPDISLLVELADFYDVDVRELIDGERKDGNMKDDVRETAEKVADYAGKEKKVLIKRVLLVTVLGLLSGLVSMLMSFLELDREALWRYVRECTAGFTLGTVICMLLYLTGALSKIRENRQARRWVKAVAAVSLALVVLCMVILALRQA